MRVISAGVGVVFSFLVVASAASAQEKTSYLPLKVGNKWTYNLDFAGQKLNVTQKVTKIEKKKGEDVASIESEVGGMMVTEQSSSGDKGVFRYSFQGMEVDPPFQALRLPVKKGETWEAKLNIQGQEFKANMKTEGEEEVSVPAGKFKAVVVATNMEIMGQQIATKSWFAPNVGIVKQTFTFGGMSGTSELEKFEPAK